MTDGIAVVFVKKGTGSYKRSDFPVVPLWGNVQKRRIEIEKELNDGLLSHEAELKLPLCGRHNDPVYRVKLKQPCGRIY